ncbi:MULTISPECIES: CHAT domain-containing protein [unclassified Massilia]|uniref:CHAT domain-containing protein n=1 Tax=unclassified Massilia TaxID=2609279 RepID=UPI00177BF1CE|nr:MULTISPECIES: CHAT domain-containing protein [unclassified Massilia]MBD8529950.1 CHAT domain-containing protein [Massilia sp. CFBP 13647]MBD8673853.1 CHAT domain-containing protein [Massilia sp. CFBP 13721]
MFRLREANTAIDGMLDYERLELGELPGMGSRQEVEDYGGALVQALNRHGAVKQQLGQFFGAVGIASANFQFDIATAEAERFRWETLYTAPQFLALTGFCSVRRIIPSGLAGQPQPRSFDGRVRMVTLLSAARVQARGEFRAIAVAFAAARARLPGFELHAYVGEMALLDEIQGDIDAGHLPGVQVAPMPATTAALEQMLRDQAPQILHCFCHGLIKDTVGLLQFATIADHVGDEAEGSVALSITRLAMLQNLAPSTWLTVLNSCDGAHPIQRLGSMAASLARTGAPVTIGMAEPIHSSDATLFSRHFYGRALRIVADAAQAASATRATAVDLGPALADARHCMHVEAQNGADQNYRRWCLPVMYQRSTGLSIVRVPPAAVQERIETVSGLLRSLPSDTPEPLRDQLRNLLESSEPKVDRSLWPDLWGNFA